MKSMLFLFLTISYSAVAQHSAINPATTPVCVAGHPLRASWGTRIVSKDTLRFNVDDSQGDPCIVYFDLEFVVEMFDRESKSLGKQRFSVPDVEIRGPAVEHFDFHYDLTKVAKIKPLMMACSKRYLGGMPGQGETPRIPPGLAADLDKERDTDWSGNVNVEYLIVESPNEMHCSSSTVSKTVKSIDECGDVVNAARELRTKRAAEIGPAITYQKTP